MKKCRGGGVALIFAMKNAFFHVYYSFYWNPPHLSRDIFNKLGLHIYHIYSCSYSAPSSPPPIKNQLQTVNIKQKGSIKPVKL